MDDQMHIARLAERLDHLESRDEIRQLAAEYARLIDGKDLEALTMLFTEDTPVGDAVGRKAKLDALIRNHGAPGKFGTTIHLISGHSITLDESDPDRATGVLYCRAEHEIGRKWVIATIQYWDEYSRRSGSWLFHRRDIRAYYVVDVLERPTPAPVTQSLTWFGVLEEAQLPAAWPSWSAFWEAQGRDPHTPAEAPST